MLRTRITGHRSKFYDCMREAEGKEIELSDEHILGVHFFYEHGLKHVKDFNEDYKFSILEVANPHNINKKKYCVGTSFIRLLMKEYFTLHFQTFFCG